MSGFDGMAWLNPPPVAEVGADGLRVVTGGQTMNPSTAELLDAVEHMNAQQVVILPNNKNIIAVAEQVDAPRREIEFEQSEREYEKRKIAHEQRMRQLRSETEQ